MYGFVDMKEKICVSIRSVINFKVMRILSNSRYLDLEKKFF